MSRPHSELSKLSGDERRTRVDLGLALLSVLNPGNPLTQCDIAAWCGCTQALIYAIEQKALRKLRVKLQFHRDPVLREIKSLYALNPASTVTHAV